MFVIISLIVIAVLAGALMAACHYAAPRICGRILHRLEAYVAGSLLGIALPFAGWHLLVWAAGEAIPALVGPVGLLVIMVGAGLGTALGWWIDDRAGKRAELRSRRVRQERRGDGQS